jgi:poly(A) polymerase
LPSSDSSNLLDADRRFAVNVVQTLKDAGHNALWAGGCVRDALLGKTPKDYDVATDATPEQVRSIFGKRRTLGVGESFGVIVVLGPKNAGQIEVATFRTDGSYVDGRRPESVQFSSPEEDAQRRDFTINGMFFDPIANEILDYVGGKDDLNARVLRAIGDPRERMEEDKLRMLRAVRFAATFDFAVEDATAAAVKNMADQIHVVSPERIAQELRRMLAHENRAVAIRLCRELDLFERILPKLNPCLAEWEAVLLALQSLQTDRFSVAFAVLFSCCDFVGVASSKIANWLVDSGKELRLSNEEIDAAEWLVKNVHRLDSAETLPLATLKRTLVQPLASDLLELMRVHRVVQKRSLSDVEFCSEFLRSTPQDILNPTPLVTGKDLIDMGLTPGPQFKNILEEVRDAQLDLEISTADEAQELVRRKIAQ